MSCEAAVASIADAQERTKVLAVNASDAWAHVCIMDIQLSLCTCICHSFQELLFKSLWLGPRPGGVEVLVKFMSLSCLSPVALSLFGLGTDTS